MLTFSTRVMFTLHGNICRKQKALCVPPKPNSDRMVMKKLCDEQMIRAVADEQNDTDNQHHDHAHNKLEDDVVFWQEDHNNDQNLDDKYNHDDDEEDSDSASGLDDNRHEGDHDGDSDNNF